MNSNDAVKIHIEANELHLLCRTCLKHNGEVNMYKKKFKGYLFSEILSTFNLLNVSQNDGYPKNICRNCADMIAQVFCFFETIDTNQTTLRNIYQSLNALVRSDHPYHCFKLENEENVTTTEPITVTEVMNNQSVASVNAKPADTLNFNLTEEFDLKKKLIYDEVLDNQSAKNVNTKPADKLNFNLTEELDLIENEILDNQSAKNVNTKPADTLNFNLTEELDLEELIGNSGSEQISTPHKKVKEKLSKIYECKNCQKIFNNRREYHSHQNEEIHLNNIKTNKYTCKFCKEVFISRMEYRFHIQKEQKRQSLCPFCKQIMHPSRLDDHLRIKHRRSPPIKCKVCGKRFLLRSRYEAHLKAHEEGFFCDICGLHCFQQSSLERHIQSHNKPKIEKLQLYICEKCGKSFKYPYMLRDHMATHGTEKPFLCSVCGSKFGSQANLYQHNFKMHKDKSIECEKCGLKFVTEKGLHEHQKTICGIRRVPKFKCKTCGETVDLKNSMFHIETHLDKFPYLCSLCGLGFTIQKEYLDHQETAHLPKTICSVCNKRFKDLARLRVHFRTHTGERPFECDECEKKFKSWANMYTHKKSIHSKEKSYKCQYCNKAFALRGNLTQHEFIHSKIKMHECPKCCKRYYTHGSLKKHMLQHSSPPC